MTGRSKGITPAKVVSGSWRGYDHVNLQAGLDAWLAGRGRQHELVGLTGFRNASFGLADLAKAGPDGAGPRSWRPSRARTGAPAAGRARRCG